LKSDILNSEPFGPTLKLRWQKEEFFPMRLQRVASIFLVGIFSACGGGGGDGGGGNNPVKVLAKAATNGDNQAGTVGAALANSFCVIATEDGNAKSGVTVNWSTPSGGQLSSAQTATAADGTACSKLTLGHTSGPQTAVAASSGSTGSPLTFHATANPGGAVELQKNGGDLQVGPINTVLSTPVSVKALDQFGNGVPGVSVDWAVTSGTASMVPTLGTTNGSGVSSSTVTMGGTAGPITITATSVGLNGSPLTFNLTATPPPLTVSIGSFFFRSDRNASSNPAVDTVAVGGAVQWNWTGGSHGVESLGPQHFTNSAIGIGLTYTVVFTQPGTYNYQCLVHLSLMTGTIVVQ
jgi:Copper binding proteins, plastocyanin/azurin family